MKYELDEREIKAVKEWNEKHLKEQHEGKEPYCGTIGGRFTFTISNTSIGQITTVECALCKAKNESKEVYEYDFTDYDSW